MFEKEKQQLLASSLQLSDLLDPLAWASLGPWSQTGEAFTW